MRSFPARFVFLLLAGCRARSPEHPTIALITVDTWRVDHFSAEHTPHLWELAGEGERFERAMAPIGLTTPAHATMLTGLMPWEHGLRANNHHGYSLDPAVTVFPETLEGWATGAFVSAYPAGPEGGLGRGWEVFDGPEDGERPGSVAVERALAWLPDDRPALLWVHLYEPHGPYNGEGGTDTERYAEEVALADRLLEPLLDELVERRATIVVAGDHGEVHDEETCGWQHERSSGEVVLHVPLFRWVPGGEARVRRDLVGLADVPGLLRGDEVAGRTHWLAESGMCEPGCSPGCSPEGLAGRDKVAITPRGSVFLRPGRGTWSVGEAPDAALLEGIPALPAPEADVAVPEGLRALGYVP